MKITLYAAVGLVRDWDGTGEAMVRVWGGTGEGLGWDW